MSEEVEVIVDEAPPEVVEEAPEAPEEAPQDEVEISLGEEVLNPVDEEEKAAPRWIKDLRKSDREKTKKIRELEAKLSQNQAAPAPAKALELPKKPTLDACDYDSDKYQEQVEQWFTLKQKYDLEQVKAKELQEEGNRAFQKKIESYNERKASLKVSDFEDAESVVLQSFSDVQQNIILQGAEDPALLAYAIGKNKVKAEELAKIKDHVKFAFAVAKLEKELKVTTRKPSAPPEKTISGTGRVTASNDSHLEKLRAKAEKTGDYSEITAYKRNLKNK